MLWILKVDVVAAIRRELQNELAAELSLEFRSGATGNRGGQDNNNPYKNRSGERKTDKSRSGKRKDCIGHGAN